MWTRSRHVGHRPASRAVGFLTYEKTVSRQLDVQTYNLTILTSEDISALVREQLASITQTALSRVIEELLVTPFAVQREWNYGTSGQSFACWTVLEHRPSNTAIAYCESGFGPSCPWGLVSITGDDMSIGMDCGWFSTLESAIRESGAWEGPNPNGYEVP